MKILFLHGWHSTPGGAKPSFLASLGHQVLNPALDPDDYALALQAAQVCFDEGRPDVVVGSSRGGAIAMNLEVGHTPLVLLCPAWKNWGEARVVKAGTLILHSPGDEIIPFEQSRELRQLSALPQEALWEVGSDHRLADEASLKALGEAVATALPRRRDGSDGGI